jgi:hypothetical protein
MAQVSARRFHLPHLTLNTDGRRHPLANTMTSLTVILGAIAILSAFDQDLHVISSWVGMAGTVIGFYAQLISETTAERFINVIFIGAAFAGWGFGMAHGGFV